MNRGRTLVSEGGEALLAALKGRTDPVAKDARGILRSKDEKSRPTSSRLRPRRSAGCSTRACSGS